MQITERFAIKYETTLGNIILTIGNFVNEINSNTRKSRQKAGHWGIHGINTSILRKTIQFPAKCFDI